MSRKVATLIPFFRASISKTVSVVVLERDGSDFYWNSSIIDPIIQSSVLEPGKLLGKTGLLDEREASSSVLETLVQNIMATSAIEDEMPDPDAVRSSVASRLGMTGGGKGDDRSEGLSELILDIKENYDKELTLERLFHWHSLLFPRGLQGKKGGCYRGDEPMRVVSGRIDKPVIHFEAPPRNSLEEEISGFLRWFNDNKSMHPFLWAGLAHLRFVTIHPFEDGNGRIARAITDLALAAFDNKSILLYAMPEAILADRKNYYNILEKTQRNGLDVTLWLEWFLHTLAGSMANSSKKTDRIIGKTRFWMRFSGDVFQAEQNM